MKASLYTIYKICRMANLGVSLDKAYIVDKAFAKRLVSFIIRVYTFRKMIEEACNGACGRINEKAFWFCFSLLVLLFGLGGYLDIKSNG